MALETLAWPSEPSLTNGDDGVDYVMGAVFSLVADDTCHGVQWRVPDLASGTLTVALWLVSTTTRLAVKTFTPVPGTYQTILFDTPVAMVTGEEYIASVLTRNYVFRSPSPSSGWVVTTPSGNVVHEQSRLSATSDPTAMPGGAFNAWYYVSPVVGTTGPQPTPDGVAIPIALGTPTLGDVATLQPDGVAIPIALGTPAVGTLTPVPDGVALPIGLGTPAVGTLTPVPDGVALPIGLGTPTLGDVATPQPDGVAIPIALGTPTVGAAVVPQPDGLALPIALGTPTLGDVVTPRPAGIAIPIALGTPTVGVPVVVTHLPPMTGSAAVTGGVSGAAAVSALSGTATIT